MPTGPRSFPASENGHYGMVFISLRLDSRRADGRSNSLKHPFVETDSA